MPVILTFENILAVQLSVVIEFCFIRTLPSTLTSSSSHSTSINCFFARLRLPFFIYKLSSPFYLAYSSITERGDYFILSSRSISACYSSSSGKLISDKLFKSFEGYDGIDKIIFVRFYVLSAILYKSAWVFLSYSSKLLAILCSSSFCGKRSLSNFLFTSLISNLSSLYLIYSSLIFSIEFSLFFLGDFIFNGCATVDN